MNGLESKAPPLAVSLAEAGRLLGVGRTTAFRLANAGQLPTIQLGGRRRVPIAALERMLARAETPPSK